MCWLISVPLICPIGSAMLHLVPRVRPFWLFDSSFFSFVCFVYFWHSFIVIIALVLYIYICFSNINLHKGIIAFVLCQLFLRILQFLLFVLHQTIKLNIEYYSDYSVFVVMLTHFIVLRKPPLYIYMQLCIVFLVWTIYQFIDIYVLIALALYMCHLSIAIWFNIDLIIDLIYFNRSD